MPDLSVYSIGILARTLGIPAATLRTWEERYGVVVPGRSPAGHRLYSRLQVEQLRFVSAQVSSGVSPADAHRLLRERAVTGMTQRDSPFPAGLGSLVLLVERDPYAASFCEHFLTSEGYGVTVAPSVERALAETVRHLPDVAVVDLMISGGQGLRLCTRFHQQLDLPVLATSTMDLRDDALAAGASAFLDKPLQPRRLVSTVQALLSRGTRPTARPH
ncbi:response regulator [Kribbella sp. NPDC051770]|uniref:response regulator n=1 Tax=Kribbella sp. NPDC051770 TaxID=3155413 RepID=UPI003424E307